MIDIEHAQELGLEEDGAHQITGATGVGEYPRFKADIEVPWLNITVRSPVGGAPLRTNNIPWNALIGRDVILQFEMRVDGVTGMITFPEGRRRHRRLNRVAEAALPTPQPRTVPHSQDQPPGPVPKPPPDSPEPGPSRDEPNSGHSNNREEEVED